MANPALSQALYWTTRSWTGFWGTAGLCAGYVIFNTLSPSKFDPFPFVLLTLILTFFAYLQNIVIMILQGENEVINKRQEEKLNRQLLYMLHLMEALNAHIGVLEDASDATVALQIRESESEANPASCPAEQYELAL
jgi:uncharacterized membrane protein